MIDCLLGIKAVFMDADDTVIDHKECERQALKHLFSMINQEYREEYQEIFRPLDRMLWNNAAANNSIVPINEIPEYRFREFFNVIGVQYEDYKRCNELFMDGLVSTAALTENAEEMVRYLYNKITGYI